jgi:hypothetical protein
MRLENISLARYTVDIEVDNRGGIDVTDLPHGLKLISRPSPRRSAE